MALSVRDERITMKYGAGGRAMRALIEEVFLDGRRARQPGRNRAARRWTTARRCASATGGSS